MELKKIREIRLTKEYLPGFAGGNDPVPGFNGWLWLVYPNYSNYIDPNNPGTTKAVTGYDWLKPLLPTQYVSTAADVPDYTKWQGPTPGSIINPSDDAIKTNLQKPIDKTSIKNHLAASKSGGSSAASIGNIVTSGLGFMGSVFNAYGPVKQEQELLANAGTSVAHGAGFDYQRLNQIDGNREIGEVNRQAVSNTLNTAATGAAFGASVGSIVPGLGTALGGIVGGAVGAITGIFGGKSRKERLRRKIVSAIQSAELLNVFNRSAAHSDFLALDYAYNHTNTQDDVLYGAKHGKDCFSLMPGYFLGKDVYTAGGLMNGPANARVAFGETIYEPGTGDATIVKHGKLDLDTNLANLKNSTVVFGNDVDVRTGKTFRDEALPYAAVLERLKK